MSAYRNLRPMLFILVGSLTSMASLWFTTFQLDGVEWPAVVAPFGIHLLAAAHLLSAIPLGWLAASYLLASFPRLEQSDRQRTARRLLLLGATSGLLTVTLGHWAQPLATSLPPAGALAVRCLWSMVLMTPWCMAARFSSESTDRGAAVHWMLALVAFILLPHSYAEHLVEKQKQVIAEAVTLGRTWKAWQATNQLLAIGSRVSFNGTPLLALRDQLTADLAAYATALQQPFSANASFAQRLERAQILTALDEMQQAQKILEPIAATAPESMLLLAAVHDVQGHTLESIAAARQAVEMLSAPPQDAARRRECLQAYSWLVNYLRKAQQYTDAEAELQEALQQDTAPEAGLRFLLAEHYRLGGRPTEAFDQYTKASADPELRDRCQAAKKDLAVGTPTCILRPARIATR